jgi:O-antigen ligase
MKFYNYESIGRPWQIINQLRIPSALTNKRLQLGLVILVSLGVGLAVIISTYYVDNVKLLIGLVGGLAFVLLTIRWPEFGILCLVALMSGLVSLTALPLLRMGPVSLNISDFILLLLLGLVFLRTTAQRGFTLFGSPLTMPLFIFIGAFLLSALNAIFVYHVNLHSVFWPVRGLSLWILFVPTLQLVRDEQALRRLLIGLLIFTGVLFIGVLFPNKLAPLFPVEVAAAGTGGQLYAGVTRIYYDGDMILYAMIPITVASLAMIKKGNQLWRIGLLGFLLFWVAKTFFREYWLTLSIVCILLTGFLSGAERLRLLKRMAPAAMAGAVIVIMLMATQPTQVERVVYSLSDRVASLGRNPLKESSLQWRVIETYYALPQISRHPLFGIGLGNPYRPPMIAEDGTTNYRDWTSRYMENGYLYIAVYMGLVGLLPFLWLCVAYLLRVLRHQYEIRDDGLRAIYLGIGAAFLGMMACNIVTPTFVFGNRLVFFPVALAISEVILRLEREKRVS